MDTPCNLHKNTVTAIYEPVETEMFQTVNSLGTESNPSEKGISHLDDLVSRSSKNLIEAQKEKLTALLHEYQDQFSRSSHDLGSTDLAEHTIRTVPGCKPVYQRPYRIPLAKQEFARNEIKQMAEKGLIESSCSPWNSPVVLVSKRNGTLRFCIDFRKVNLYTIPDKHPLPNPEDTLGALGGSKWFSTVDLKSGFHQIKIKESDRPLTAFSIPGSGHWQFRVLPFGLINSGSVFERTMERVFDRLTFKFLLIYLDDLIIHSKTAETHLENLREVFQRLKESNLKLNPEKCNLFCKTVTFLGHQVSEDGITTDPDKIRAIKEWPRPSSVKEVRQFIGLASYYRKFIPGFATICKPLHTLTEKPLTEKKVPFEWSDKAQTAFDCIKSLLTTAPVLSYADPNGGDFVLDTDASDVGVGAVLHQLQNGEEKVIGYYSRCLKNPERKYCTTRKELVAVVSAVTHFHHYLYGREFVVRTDHSSLRWLMNFRNTGQGQLARFLETLSAYTFKLEYRQGRLHNNADALSRRPCYSDNCIYCTRYEKNYLPGEQSGTTEQETVAKMPCQQVGVHRENSCSDVGAPQEHHMYIGSVEQEFKTDARDIVDSLVAKKVDTAIENVSRETTSIDDASICDNQDKDPAICNGPILFDDIVAGREACSTSASGRGVLSDKMTPLLPSGSAHHSLADKIHYFTVNKEISTSEKPDIYCSRPYTCCCQVAQQSGDWLEQFDEEPLFEHLFGRTAERADLPPWPEVRASRAGRAFSPDEIK